MLMKIESLFFFPTVIIVLTIMGVAYSIDSKSVKADYALMLKLWLLRSHGRLGGAYVGS